MQVANAALDRRRNFHVAAFGFQSLAFLERPAENVIPGFDLVREHGIVGVSECLPEPIRDWPIIPDALTETI